MPGGGIVIDKEDGPDDDEDNNKFDDDMQGRARHSMTADWGGQLLHTSRRCCLDAASVVSNKEAETMKQ